MIDNFEAVLQAVERLNAEEKQKLLDYLQREQQAPPRSKHRIPGLHEHLGHAWMSEDFDDELPDSFWLGEA